MYSIYKNAIKVLVWLGSKIEYTEPAFDFIDAHQDVDLWPIQRTQMMQRYRREGSNSYPKYDPGIADAFRQLLDHPWFTRVWIFQESVANPNTEMQQGDLSTHWDKFVYACGLFSHMLEQALKIGSEAFMPKWKPARSIDAVHFAASMRPSVPYTSDPPHQLPCQIEPLGIRKTDSLVMIRHMADVRSATFDKDQHDHDHQRLPNTTWHHPRLKELLPILRNSRATDPRDKVFGLLSLAGAKHDSSVLPHADYQRTLCEVYLRTVRYWLNSEPTQDLSFLNHVEYPSDVDHLPSWAPDWSTGFDVPRIVSHNPLPTKQHPYRAGGESQASAEITYHMDLHSLNSINLLKVKGVHYMSIARIETSDNVGTCYLDIVGRDRIFLGIYPTTKMMPYLTAFRNVVEALCLVRHDRVNFWHTKAETKSSPEASFTTEDEQRISNELVKIKSRRPTILYEECGDYKRAFFVSDSGFMGFAPRAALPGDAVCVLHGATTPFVLRRDGGGGYWKLLGECYVFGIMNGEVMEELPAAEELIFEIC
jgi:hypothetical protein